MPESCALISDPKSVQLIKRITRAPAAAGAKKILRMRPHPIKETLQKLKPFIGKKTDLLWIRYQTAEKIEKPEWERNINLLAQKYCVDVVEDTIILPPPSPEVSHGDIDIGNIRYLNHNPIGFGLKKSELTRHVGIFGSTGSGENLPVKEYSAAVNSAEYSLYRV